MSDLPYRLPSRQTLSAAARFPEELRMPFDNPELLTQFVTESRDHLAHVEGRLLEIEAGGANFDIELVNNVFRGIHSIKGAAGFLGLATVNKLAHSLENVLGLMRNRELTPTSSMVDVMLRAADALTQLVNDAESSNQVDVSKHIVALDQIYASPAERVASTDVESHNDSFVAETAVEEAPNASSQQPAASLNTV